MERRGHEVSAEQFQRGFALVSPLIQQEWPGLDTTALQATEGDLEQVTALVAGQTDRTRVAIRRQLAELHAMASPPAPSAAESGAAAPNGASKGATQINELVELVRRLEALASEQAQRVTGQLMPKAEAKVKQNLWISLLFALGFGLILGLWLNGRGRGGGRHD